MIRKTLLGFTALLLTLLCATSASALQYNIADLGGMIPFDMNDAGMVAGLDRGPVVLDSRTMERTGLQAFGEPIEGMCINGQGIACGFNYVRTFLWTQEEPTELDSGPGFTEPVSINNQGKIAGNVWSGAIGDLYSRAFVWENGVMTLLNLQYADESSEAIGIDGSGRIIGNLAGRAAMWENASAQPALFCTYDHGKACAASDDGTIVVLRAGPWFQETWSIWRDGAASPFTLPALPEGFQYEIGGVNNSGVVTGYGVDGYGYTSFPFVWTETGGFLDLSTFFPMSAGWERTKPVAVNNNGQILVSSETPYPYQIHTLLFDPVPEPSSLLALGGGLLALGGLIRRKR